MGVHFLNMSTVGPTLDPTKPQVLIYEPQGDKLVLVAAEWFMPVQVAGSTHPAIFGQQLNGPMEGHPPIMPPELHHYDLHVWLWRAESGRGVLADQPGGEVREGPVLLRGRSAEDGRGPRALGLYSTRDQPRRPPPLLAPLRALPARGAGVSVGGRRAVPRGRPRPVRRRHARRGDGRRPPRRPLHACPASSTTTGIARERPVPPCPATPRAPDRGSRGRGPVRRRRQSPAAFPSPTRLTLFRSP